MGNSPRYEERKDPLGCCLYVFLQVLRKGEVVVPSTAVYDPDVHLSEADVKVNSRSKLSYIKVQIKASKTDVF